MLKFVILFGFLSFLHVWNAFGFNLNDLINSDPIVIQKENLELQLENVNLRLQNQILSDKNNELEKGNLNEVNLLNEMQKLSDGLTSMQSMFEPVKSRIEQIIGSKIEPKLDDNLLTTSCAEALNTGESGAYHIKLPQYDPIRVYCYSEEDGGNWTVVQRRTNGNVNFYRSLFEYKKGFGDVNDEYWIGLDNLHRITANEPQELRFVIEDYNNNRKYANYAEFEVSSECDGYRVTKLGSYSGNAGNNFEAANQQKFTTFDHDNDNRFGENCAITRKGGWWYNDCTLSNLNGLYLDKQYGSGNEYERIFWISNGSNHAVKTSLILIRPKN